MMPSSPIDMLCLKDTDPARLVNLILGVEWIDDDVFQHAVVLFLNSPFLFRDSVIVLPTQRITLL